MCLSSWYKKWEEKVLGCLRGSLFHKMVLVAQGKLRQPDIHKALFMGPVADDVHWLPHYLKRRER